MQKEKHFHVKVKNIQGKVVLDWVKPLTGDMTVLTEGDRVIIERKNMFGIKKYIANRNESVETSNWSW